jgi:hypothetical protein
VCSNDGNSDGLAHTGFPHFVASDRGFTLSILALRRHRGIVGSPFAFRIPLERARARLCRREKGWIAQVTFGSGGA